MVQEADAHGIPITALKQDYAFKAVDDYNFRMYILPHLVNPESRSEIKSASSERMKFPLSRTPWVGGNCPVSIVEWLGIVSGALE